MFRKLLLLMSLAGSFYVAPAAHSLIPLSNAEGQFIADADGNLLLDPNFTFGDLSPLTEAGSFEVDPIIAAHAGYDPSRVWSVGDHPVDVLKFGDLQGLGIDTLTTEQINGAAGEFFIAEMELLDDLNLRELVTAVPRLGSRPVGSVGPLKAALPSQLWPVSIRSLLDEDSNQIVRRLTKQRIPQLRATLRKALIADQEFTISGIAEGFDVTTAGIVEQLQGQDPTLQLDFKPINQQILEQINLQLVDADAELGKQLDDYLDTNFHLRPGNIDRAINFLVEKHRQTVSDVIVNSQNNLIESIKTQVKSELGLEQLAIIDSQFSDLNNAVGGFIADSGVELSASLSDVFKTEATSANRVVSGLPKEIGSLSLDQLDFDSFQIKDVPGLAQTVIKRFPGYKDHVLGGVAGIENLRFARLPNLPVYGGGIARIDWVFSEIEGYADRAISGSKKDGFNDAFCYQDESENGGCAHIELTGNFNDGRQWVSGDSQKVRGGNGLLGRVGGGKEPTGRIPFPDSPFKMVLRHHDEVSDTVDLRLAFRFCMTIPFSGKTCTPHNIFEIPFTSYEEGEWIYLGVDI